MCFVSLLMALHHFHGEIFMKPSGNHLKINERKVYLTELKIFNKKKTNLPLNFLEIPFHPCHDRQNVYAYTYKMIIATI